MLTSFIEQIVSPQYLASLSMLLYTLSFLPQIIENYRYKSGSGLSDYFLLAYLHTYMTLFFYIFSLHVNIAYKIACPLQALAVLILIVQRLYYNRSQAKLFSLIYLANVMIYIVFIPFGILNPTLTGHVFGWASFLLTLLNPLPQVLKVFYAKSVVGFSYRFVLIMGLAAVCELYASVMLGLPLQTIFSAARGLVYFVIFSLLFVTYSKK